MRYIFLGVNWFNWCPLNAAIVWYLPSISAHMYLCIMRYPWLWPNCCKADIEVMINCYNAWRWAYGITISPATCTNHQFTVISQAWGGGRQQPERHPLAQNKYDTFVTSAYFRQHSLNDTVLKLSPNYQYSVEYQSFTFEQIFFIVFPVMLQSQTHGSIGMYHILNTLTSLWNKLDPRRLCHQYHSSME